MKGLTVVVLMLALLRPASACQIFISPALLQGRVAGMTLTIHGVAVSAASIKPGWTLSITNDPSWKTNVTGHAIVGAAFLSGSELLSMLTFSPQPGLSCKDIPQQKHLPAMTLTFYRDDALVRTEIGSKDLRFVQ